MGRIYASRLEKCTFSYSEYDRFQVYYFFWLQMHCMQMLKKSPTANFGNSFFTLDFQTAERDEQVSRRNQRLANLIYKMF